MIYNNQIKNLCMAPTKLHCLRQRVCTVKCPTNTDLQMEN